MVVLSSRKNYSPESFLDEFLKSLIPALIPRSDFIKWASIDDKLKRLKAGSEFYQDLKYRIITGKSFVNELSDSLLSADNSDELIQCAFELLGHTSEEFATLQDDIKIAELARNISSGDRAEAIAFAEMLKGLGFETILAREQIEDALFGVQVGLETHRRKNIGGAGFANMVNNLFEEIAASLTQSGIDVLVKNEAVINFEGGSKKVDLAILRNGYIKCGVEINFYTVSGSKPTEMKRSYADIGQRLEALGITMIWITDGKGYRFMQRSLKDAFSLFPNIYNFNMAKQHLASDLLALFSQ